MSERNAAATAAYFTYLLYRGLTGPSIVGLMTTMGMGPSLASALTQRTENEASDKSLSIAQHTKERVGTE